MRIAALGVLLAGCGSSFSYCLDDPLDPPALNDAVGGGLSGFDSPYIARAGGFDGHGNRKNGRPRTEELVHEAELGFRWTWSPVYWRAFEPTGPANPEGAGRPPAWDDLDASLVAAHAAGLNVLLAPSVSLLAEGPPEWAGTDGSAPTDIDTLVEFVEKLAGRYGPGGTLSAESGFTDGWGVRAWQFDESPDTITGTGWTGQEGDYAEFANLAAQQIRALDPDAVIVGPGGSGIEEWLDRALTGERGTARYEEGPAYGMGSAFDVVGFIMYEWLAAQSVDCQCADFRRLFEAHEQDAPDPYAPKDRYWHVGGGYDLVGLAASIRLANWRWQWFARAFAAGLHKVTLEEWTAREEDGIATWMATLPDPFPMVRASDAVEVVDGAVTAFRHDDRGAGSSGAVWVVWADNGTRRATVRVPVTHDAVIVHSVDGEREAVTAVDGMVELTLIGDEKWSPPVLVEDR